MEKWLYCKGCNRVFKYKSEELRKHIRCGRGRIIKPSAVPFWHCLYQPELLLDALRYQLEEFWSWLKK